MFRRRLLDPGYWRWYWSMRASPAARLVVGAAVLGLLFVGGWFGARHLTAADAQTATGRYVIRETVQKVVTLRRRGKVIRRLVPVVRRVTVAPETRYATEVVTVPGVVKQPVVRYVPTVRDRIVTVGGKTTTVSETRLVPTTTDRTRTAVVTATQTRTVTNPQTVTNQNTVTRTLTTTDTRTVTNSETVVRTVTSTLPVTVTETLPVTVTLTTEVTTTVKR